MIEPPSNSTHASPGRPVLDVLREAMARHGLENVFSYHIVVVEADNDRDNTEVFRLWFRYHATVKLALFRTFGAWKGTGANLGAFMVPRTGVNNTRTSSQVTDELQALLKRHFKVIVWTVRKVTRVERSHYAADPYAPANAAILMDEPIEIDAIRIRQALGLRPKATFRIMAPHQDDPFSGRFWLVNESGDGAANALPGRFHTRYARLLLQVVDTRMTWYASLDVATGGVTTVATEELPASIRIVRDSFEFARRPMAEVIRDYPLHHRSPEEHSRKEHYRTVGGKRVKVRATVVAAKRGDSSRGARP